MNEQIKSIIEKAQALKEHGIFQEVVVGWEPKAKMWTHDQGVSVSDEPIKLCYIDVMRGDQSIALFFGENGEFIPKVVEYLDGLLEASNVH